MMCIRVDSPHREPKPLTANFQLSFSSMDTIQELYHDLQLIPDYQFVCMRPQLATYMDTPYSI